MKSKQVIYSCEEHIEMCMDDFVDDYNTFPVMTKNNDYKCKYCQKKSEYKLENAS